MNMQEALKTALRKDYCLSCVYLQLHYSGAPAYCSWSDTDPGPKCHYTPKGQWQGEERE